MHARVRTALGAAAALLTVGAGAGTAQAATTPALHCKASTLAVSGVGVPTPVAPVSAGGDGPCANASAAPSLPTNPLLSGDALAKTTWDSSKRLGTATGGLLSLKVLPTPDATAALDQAIGTVGAAVPATLTLPGLVPTVLSVLVDARDALRAQLIPTGAVLTADALIARAAVGCAGGAPQLAGSSALTDVRVMGQPVPLDGPVTKTLTLYGGQSIPLSSLDAKSMTITGIVSALPLGLLGTTVADLSAKLQDGLATLSGSIPAGKLPALSLDVSLAPGGQVRSGDTLTQHGLTAKVDLGGVHLLDATIGEATVSADAGACANAPTGGGTTPQAPAEEGGVEAVTAAGSVADQILACTDRGLVLVDVLRKGNMVKLLGAANRDYVGRRVAIRLLAAHRVVAHATVHADGSFQTTAPLPPRRLRTPANRNLVRYSAEIGKERSLPLKLRRRMIVSSMSSSGGHVTIAGRVLGPLTHPATTIRLVRRLSCQRVEVVKTFTPRADGRFRVTVPAPDGPVAAVYRMSTQVRANRHNPKRFPTFTLPRGVALNTR